MGRKITRNRIRRYTAFGLCICMVMSVFGEFGVRQASAAAPEGEETEESLLVQGSRKADPDTMDAYQDALLSDEAGSNGSRYAGRVWTDKTVFAYGADAPNGGGTGTTKNVITLAQDTDGYEGNVSFNADFAHVFSALASSQVVHEYPPTPIDLVIAIDMSGSMGQDVRYDINDKQYAKEGEEQKHPMADRIENSRIQATVNAVNDTIDTLMEQNRNNRVAVVCYGAGASVLMPLAHYQKTKEREYITVDGMETLYDPTDLKFEDNGWYWTKNRDTCYVISAKAYISTSNQPEYEFDSDDPEASYEEYFGVDAYDDEGKGKSGLYHKSVSNNVINEKVKAYPGCETQEAGGVWEEGLLYSKLQDTKELDADEYVGYYTNTQGGIFLAYSQLANGKYTTYTEKLSTEKPVTVARIPAAIIMTDGGANFAFNKMNYWGSQYGATGISNEKAFNADNNRFDSDDYSDFKGFIGDGNGNASNYGDPEDHSHRLPGTGDEWYQVYLPGIADKNTITSLYNPGMERTNGKLEGAPRWNYAGIFYQTDINHYGAPGTILEVLMTASYMKTVVDKHYDRGWEDGMAEENSRIPLSTYTVSVDSEKVPQWGRARLYPTLDPEDYFLPLENENDGWNESWNESKYKYTGDKSPTGPDTDPEASSETVKMLLQGAYNKWKIWTEDNDLYDEEGMKPRESNGVTIGRNETININRLKDGDNISDTAGYTDMHFDGDKGGITVTNGDVEKNINYSDGFSDVESTDVSEYFEQILQLIMGNVFVPVSGGNDAGVNDSITYQDPIGKYMEIKNQSIVPDNTVSKGNGEGKDNEGDDYDMSMLLFGQMHGLVRAGVYDYNWNLGYIQQHDLDENDPFPSGWFKGPDPQDARNNKEENGEEKTTLPDGCTTAEEAWQAGWVYRLSYKELLEFVPILKRDDVDSPNSLPGQMKNTEYTVYRFADLGNTDNTLHINPVYGTIPPDLQDKWDDLPADAEEKKDNSLYSKYPGVYRLSDIRVWVEDTGNYVDTQGAITPEKSGYDESLYVNIPVAAVPTQLAEITLGPEGVLSYMTNLTEKAQSTPLRLFYAVGLDEQLIIRDGSGKQIGVNTDAIPEEYIETHRNNEDNSNNDDNSIWFISNYYSNTRYEGYVTDELAESRTRGDPTVTFSPGSDNRYYLFQNPQELYAHAYRVQEGGKLAPVDWAGGNWSAAGVDAIEGNGSTTWETYDGAAQQPGTWVGGMYMGTYENATAFEREAGSIGAENEITDANGEKFTYQSGSIVFLQDDLLDHVTTDKDGNPAAGSSSFSSNDYYFLLVDYYIPNTEDGKDLNGQVVLGASGADAVQRVITRKGSEFGSGLNSEGIGNGDLLCWTDLKGNTNLAIAYKSQTETGDRTRGEPTYEKLFYTEEDLESYLRGLGFNDNEIEGEKSYWLEVQGDEHLAKKIKEIKEEIDEQKQKEAYESAFHWAVAARSGAIRTGDMFQNRKAKSRNTTVTANNYYVPTVATSSKMGNFIIDNYLGNNGRLAVPDQNLLVTKTVILPDGKELTEDEAGLTVEQKNNLTFNYQVYIEGATGSRDAVVVEYNDQVASDNAQGWSPWQKKISTIDVLTDNAGLLTYKDGRRVLVSNPTNGVEMTFYVETDGSFYTVNENGEQGEAPTVNGDGLYYIYFSSSDNSSGTESAGSSNKHRVWDSSISANTTPQPGSDGSRKYPANVELIPRSEVSGNSNWTHSSSVEESHVQNKSIVILTTEPTVEAGRMNLISRFNTETSYETRTLVFGKHMDGDLIHTGKDKNISLSKDDLYDGTIFGKTASEVAAHTAEFTLQHHEGLLFTGLRGGLGYRVTEKLTGRQDGQDGQDGQMDLGIALDHADQVHGTGNPEEVLGIDSLGNPDRGVYSVSGNTDQFDKVHYYNTFRPGIISITKTLKAENGTNGTEITDKDRDTEFSFTLELKEKATGDGIGDGNKTPFDGTFSYTVLKEAGNEAGGSDETIVREGRLLPSSYQGDLNPSDVKASPSGTWQFTLKGGQTMRVNDLPAGLEFTYTITETPSEEFGYDVEITQDGDKVDVGEGQPLAVSGTVKPDDTGEVKVEFANTKNKPLPATMGLQLRKSVTAEAGSSYTGKGPFTFLVTPSAGNPADDPILQASGWNEKEGAMTVSVNGSGDVVVFAEGTEFGTSGTYEYTVREVIPQQTLPGISYDTTVYNVKIVVEEEYKKEDGDAGAGTDMYTGKLKATMKVSPDREGNGSVTFSNRFNPNKISIPLKVHKSVVDQDGNPLPVGDEDYSFKIEGISAATASDAGKATPANAGPASVPAGTGSSQSVGPGLNGMLPQQPLSLPRKATQGLLPDSSPADADAAEKGGSAADGVGKGVSAANGAGKGVSAVDGAEKGGSAADGAGKGGNAADGAGKDGSAADGGGKAGTAAPAVSPLQVPSRVTVRMRSALRTAAPLIPPLDKVPGITIPPVAGAEEPAVEEPSVEEPAAEEPAAENGTARGSAGLQVKQGTGDKVSKEKSGSGESSRSDPVLASMPPMPDPRTTAFVSPDGYAYFDSIEFTEPGTYTYKITETAGDKTGITYDSAVWIVTVTVTRDSESGALQAETEYRKDGSEDGPGHVQAEFENRMETGGLTVKKTVLGNAGEKDKEFGFEVKITDRIGRVLENISGPYGEMTFTNGVAEFTLKHGESKQADGLPAGAHFTVKEEDYSEDGYTTTYEGEVDEMGKGVINGSQNADVDVQNERDGQGNLSVTKTVTGNSADTGKEWHFRVELSDETINGRYGDMTFADGVAEFTLKHGETKTATGLPSGITYTVTESEANQEGYTTSPTGDKGTVPEGGTAKAEFVNSKEETETPPEETTETPPEETTETPPEETTETPPETPPEETTETPPETPPETPTETPYETPPETHQETEPYTEHETSHEPQTESWFETSAHETPAESETVPPEPLTRLPDDEEAPYTGDSRHPVFWLAVMAVSMAAAWLSLRQIRRIAQSEKVPGRSRKRRRRW